MSLHIAGEKLFEYKNILNISIKPFGLIFKTLKILNWMLYLFVVINL